MTNGDLCPYTYLILFSGLHVGMEDPHLWMLSDSIDQDQAFHDKFLKAKTL